MSVWKFYKEFGRYVFYWPLLFVEVVSLGFFVFGSQIKELEGTYIIGAIEEYALIIFWLALFVGLIIAPLRHYRKIVIEKSEEYLKHNEEARKDRACRVFYDLHKDAKYECESSPERREKWELMVEKSIVDYLKYGVKKQYMINKNMCSGPTEEETKLAQNKYMREFVEGQLNDEFSMTI